MGLTINNPRSDEANKPTSRYRLLEGVIKMDYKEEKELVFAGLRACDIPPDYLLYIGEFPDDYKGNLSGITVIFNGYISEHPRDSAMSRECNFIPCWIDPQKDCSIDFYNNYDSYNIYAL